MLHFSPNYYFFHITENASKPRHHMGSYGQPKNMQCYTGCNIFRHLHQQNASGETTEKKHGNHVTFPCHTCILHVTVTFKTSHVTSHRTTTTSTSETLLKNQIRSTLNPGSFNCPFLVLSFSQALMLNICYSFKKNRRNFRSLSLDFARFRTGSQKKRSNPIIS